MITVTVGTNHDRNHRIVEPTTILRHLLEEEKVDYAIGILHLDGSALENGDIDKSFADLGKTDRCFLLNVVKADDGS